VICGLIAILATGDLDDLEPVVGLFIAFYWLHNIVDAGRRPASTNQALAGLRPMDLPEDVQMPQPLGSLVGGVPAHRGRLMLFAHTMFGCRSSGSPSGGRSASLARARGWFTPTACEGRDRGSSETSS